MARIKRELGVDGQACAFIICHEKDGVVNEPPYLDLGYAFPYRQLHSIDVLTRMVRHQDLSASHQHFTTISYHICGRTFS